MITPAAKAWLVSLACDPHELWSTRLFSRHAREQTRGRTQMSPPSGSGHGVQASRSGGNQT
ncbi:hypothetical protein [Bradyrhizobium sp. I1.8.5]|uniref:hypothetical protein n=1 Tax=Bradyrhizobium sp. I1.8.5 TaxID=3156365 RepID=UPI0033923A03